MTQMTRITGVETVIRNFKKHRRWHAAGVGVGIKKATLLVLRASQQIVPVDTGTLKGSADTHFSGVGFDTTGAISYNTDYAIYVHEDLDARHKAGKQAKYLEQPARVLAPTIRSIIAVEATRKIL